MGDRCYMSIHCRREHAPRFEELGFILDHDDPKQAHVLMVDEQASYAHDGDMPTDVPWYGGSAAGSNYGEGRWSCDGTTVLGIDTGFNHDGFVVQFNERTGRPDARSVKRVQRWLKHRARAERLVEKP